MNRRHFFAALFAPLLAALGVKAAAPVYRTTMGLQQVINTNITSCAGGITLRNFEIFARSAFRYGSRPKIMICTPEAEEALRRYARTI